ncbi:alpha/beta hydrolase [Aeromicrobium sp. Root495]|uniref:alpha/beta hydrolase n=1 Tax=Aeromicrobium sp. Root495 TaxID=1736550 RepID=UPI0006FEC439|nr:alpha/beta fold hydrolase [Aeromicrobium sp. Root495]KQY59923.1 alpha/beta hydrolase [Aeromicrobium sp. Root495]
MTGREDVSFVSGGTTCRAWLYRPAAPAGDVPVIVMAHGLGGVREMRLDAFAERFAAAGYACLVFDYRHFGASDGEPRQLLSVRRQRQDWKAAVAFARGLRDVDAERVVLWGSSFSGGHVIAIGADDHRVAAVVSQCPFTDGLSSTLAVPPLTSLRLTVRAVVDLVGSWFGRKPLLVPLAAEPGGLGLMSAPDALPGYVGLVQEGSTFRNEASARTALGIVSSYPGRRAKALAAPAFFVVCDTDTVAPAKATLRHVAKAPRGEVLKYPAGHFDIYRGEHFEQVVSAETEFLQRVVPVA